LYKENIDTSTAAKDVTRFAHLNPKRGINYAGMKDKRGVTTQFCSAFRVEKEQLLAINKRDGVGGGNSSTHGSCIIRVGNLTYSNDEVKLGALSGNRFDIVLRNIDTGDDDNHDTIRRKLALAGEAFKQYGFINYFGMQRFGKSIDTHEVGLQVLKGDFEGAIDIIMREKADGDSPRVLEARRSWAKRFDGVNVKEDEAKASKTEGEIARQVEKMCSRFMVCEKSIVSSLSRKPRDYKRAFTSISKNMRSMFLHAYQSFLWNKVASFRIKTGGSTEVREGDLVLIEDKSLGDNGGGTSGLKGKRVKVVDELDLKEGTFTIEDVVLPLVGSRVDYPTGSSGDFLVELMDEDGISKDAFKQIGDKEISLCGDYRKLMCKPSDVSYEVKEYFDPLQPLINTDLMKLSGVTAETEEAKKDEQVLFGMMIGFTLPPSAYATIALRELMKRPTSSEYQSKLEVSSGKCERNLVCS
jgi:tRNA pseudouridine13 synthase